jgi:hypothetical protein
MSSRRDLIRKAFFAPPESLRKGPFSADAFPSRLHSEKIASLLGIALGISFSVCFVTGLLSHLIQQPPGWFFWPSGPAGLYRVTQGVHVATGIASVPLLLAKLWAVYPRLYTWPPVRSFVHALERISLVALVGGSLFLLFSGMANIGLWYPWGFFFPTAHFWASWIAIGGLIIHIGAKASTTRRALAEPDDEHSSQNSLSRRGFLGVVGGTAGLLTLTTVGQTFGPLNRLAILAPRRPDIGPQGFPVNKSAAAAKVEKKALSPDYRLVIDGAVSTPLILTLDELRAMPQTEAVLPIACVEGWSTSQRWRGVRVRDLLDRAGARVDATILVDSLQPSGLYKDSELPAEHARAADTLLALQVNDEDLHIDHGYPARLIAPNRPGVLQTKWVARMTVS